MKKLAALLAALCLFALAGSALAAPEPQEAAPVPDVPAVVDARVTAVNVVAEGTDSLGSRLGTALKEAFNTSSLFRLTAGDEPKMVIVLATRPEFPTRPAIGSVYGIIWTFSQADGYLSMLLDKEVGVVSAEDMDALVARLIEKTDGLSVKYASLWRKK